MNDTTRISLQTKSILNVPLRNYEDFWFIVNGKTFKTTRIISDLLSPLICQIHSTDPTLNEFIINTKSNGDFEKILQLSNFNEEEISNDELSFFSEIFEILETETINFNDQEQINNKENTVENILNKIYKRTKYSIIDSKCIENEINFTSSHFYEILERQEQIESESKYYELERISIDLLERILENPNLQIDDEDQLLTFINHLYSNDRKYSILYKFIQFKNISSNKMNEFLNEFDINDITNETWHSISIRLKQDLKQTCDAKNRYRHDRPNKNGKSFEFNSNDQFNGINNFLVKLSNGQIDGQIHITSSNYRGSSKPENVVLYENQSIFQSQSVENAFICFDYLEHKVIPKNYVIKSADYDENVYHPKSWVIEGSNDNKKWEICDEQNNNLSLNGNNNVKMFQIQNEENKEFRYIRIRQTQKNWGGDNDLMIQSFELFGTLI